MHIRHLRDFFIAPFAVVKNLLLYRHILLQMISREIKGRFAGSMGGMLWHFIHPVLMLAVYLFVFVYIFKLRVGGGGGAAASTVYLMSGLFPWFIFAEGVVRGTSSVIENATLIQKTYFPTEILTARAVAVPLLSYGIAIVLLGIYQGFTGGLFSIILVVPVIVALQVLFTLGISLLGAAFSVFFRDIVQLVHVVTNFWLFVTPILYPVGMLPEWAQKVMYLNPLYPLMSLYHAAFLRGAFGDWHMLALTTGWALISYMTGTFFFTKLKQDFADWL